MLRRRALKLIEAGAGLQAEESDILASCLPEPAAGLRDENHPCFRGIQAFRPL